MMGTLAVKGKMHNGHLNENIADLEELLFRKFFLHF